MRGFTIILISGLLSLFLLGACARATPTPTPQPTVPVVQSPEDLRSQFEAWPEGYKFAIDQDLVVRLAYPRDVGLWAGFAFITHIPSSSSVTLARPFSIVMADGSVTPAHTRGAESIEGEEVVVYRLYRSKEGKARLEAAVADEALMRRILGDSGHPPTPPPSTPSPPDDRILDDPMRDMTREEVIKRLGVEIVPAAGPETKGYKIDVAGRIIHLPEDAYIGGLWTVYGGPGPIWQIIRGNSTVLVHKVTGEVLGMEIAPGEEGTFDFLLQALP